MTKDELVLALGMIQGNPVVSARDENGNWSEEVSLSWEVGGQPVQMRIEAEAEFIESFEDEGGCHLNWEFGEGCHDDSCGGA